MDTEKVETTKWTLLKRKWFRSMGCYEASITRSGTRNLWCCNYGTRLVKEFCGKLAEAKAWMDANAKKIAEHYHDRQEVVI